MFRLPVATMTWSGRDGDLQHAVALMGEQLVSRLDLIEVEVVRHHRREIDPCLYRKLDSAISMVKT
jgi:hypothetical protein